MGAPDGAGPRDVACRRRDLEAILDCPLCLKPLCQPVTTMCGHNYCRYCLADALEHRNECPLCRSPCHMASDHPINVTLAKVIECALTSECLRERNEEVRTDRRERRLKLPVFRDDLVQFPGVPLSLHLFEERYRTLAKRCAQGTRRFAVVYRPLELVGSYDDADLVGRVGCVVDIKLSHETVDGRWFVHATGARRIRVMDTTREEDGLVYASCQEIDDPEMEAFERDLSTQSIHARVGPGNIGLRGPAAHPVFGPLMQRLQRAMLEYFDATLWTRLMPYQSIRARPFAKLPDKPEPMSYFVASTLPVTNKEKQRLLSAPTARERMELEIEMLQALAAKDVALKRRVMWIIFGIIGVILALVLIKSCVIMMSGSSNASTASSVAPAVHYEGAQILGPDALL